MLIAQAKVAKRKRVRSEATLVFKITNGMEHKKALVYLICMHHRMFETQYPPYD